MQVERRRILDLSSDPANVRTHDDRNIDAIAASLRRFGQQKPIVVDANGVVRAGNGTLEAAKRLGWESIEVVRSDLAGSEATAYAIADNRTAELAGWDEASLAAQLGALKAEDAELLAGAGFTEAELAGLVPSVTEFVARADIDTHSDYQSHVIRQIILVFTDEEYSLVVAALAKCMEQNGLANNTECITHLLETNGYGVSRRAEDTH